jgi:dihydrofolate synthase/folylpolyglutamate synthase
LKSALQELFTYRHLILIFGASSDKDIEGMMRELFPMAHQVIVAQSRHPRAADVRALQAEALALGREAVAAHSLAEALNLALESADSQDLICVTGSVFVVAEAREAWAGRGGSR